MSTIFKSLRLRDMIHPTFSEGIFQGKVLGQKLSLRVLNSNQSYHFSLFVKFIISLPIDTTKSKTVY